MSSEETGYWTRRVIGRRAALRSAAGIGLSAAAGGLVACSSNKANTGKAQVSATTASGKATTAATAATAAATRAAAAATSPTPAALDPTKGKPGGTFKANTNIYPSGLTIVDRRDNIISKMAGLVHSGLLGFVFGTPAHSGTDVTEFEPDLATALPEQPDDVTYVFKLRPAKFQNGRTVVSQDVAYSYDRYANYDKSAWKSLWTWFDHVETPDAQTAVVKSKAPFADGLATMAANDSGFIMAKEYEESPDAANKIMGSGPFLFVSSEAPVSSSYKRNPDYYAQPYPYFDQVQLLATTDTTKRVADFTSHNVNLTWWNDEATRDQIKKNRPDATLWFYPGPGHILYMRDDKPPFNDARVRQALSMSMDRKAISQAVFEGEGQDDQALSASNTAWGFRKPRDLGAAAKYWNYDVQAAKQLLSAAGITKPIETTWSYGIGIGGNATANLATITEAQWQQAGIANIKDNGVDGNTYLNTIATGNYDGMEHGPGSFAPIIGSNIFAYYYWPPGGQRSTLNAGYISDAQLSTLVQKQLTQLKLDERKQSFHDIEQIIADNQYVVVFPTISYSWFGDSTLKNAQAPGFAYSGSARYFMYWWFG